MTKRGGGRPFSPAFHRAMELARCNATMEMMLAEGIPRRTAFRARRVFREVVEARRAATKAERLELAARLLNQGGNDARRGYRDSQ